ncbi:MAG: hypothetical protein AB3K77_05365 [Methanosarcinaceae archaeon]
MSIRIVLLILRIVFKYKNSLGNKNFGYKEWLVTRALKTPSPATTDEAAAYPASFNKIIRKMKSIAGWVFSGQIP